MSPLPNDDVELFRLALEGMGVGLWVYDLASGQVEWNQQMHDLTGVTEPLTPERYRTYIHPDDRAIVEASTRQSMQGAFKSVPHRFVRPDGQVRWLQTFGKNQLGPDGRPVRIIGGNVDITEQRQLEESLRTAHRLETVGQLAAGISHNFNNLLATMLPAIELAKSGSEGELRDALQEASAAGRRAAELVRQVSAWTRNETAAESRVDAVDVVVERVVGMCRRFFERTYTIECDLHANEIGIRGPLAELEQAVMNLLVNSRDAMRDANTSMPRIQVSTERVSAETVRIRVKDNGPGIPPELQSRIFEPFFTTKPPGLGTGLGLSTVLATMQRVGGSVRCESGDSVGATFELFLPTSSLETRHTPVPATPHRAEGVVVLVVDDEAPVRRAVARLLERYGYRVQHAQDGTQALEVLKADSQVTVVLLDQAMPTGHGADVAPLLRAARPGIRIFFHTGHDVSDAHRKLVDGVLLKPTAPELLLATLQRQIPRA